jgi:hypothetical protein
LTELTRRQLFFRSSSDGAGFKAAATLAVMAGVGAEAYSPPALASQEESAKGAQRTQVLPSLPVVASKAALKSLQAGVSIAILDTETHPSSIWKWVGDTPSLQFRKDKTEAVYIAPDESAEGAWVRQFSGPLDVRWFGAVGDGVADDRPAIQAALEFVRPASAWAQSSANGNPHAGDHPNTIYVPPGRYKCHGALIVYSKTTLQGSRIGSVIELHPDSDDSDLIRISGASSPSGWAFGVAIRELTLQTTKALSRAIGDADDLKDLINSRFEALNIHAPYQVVFRRAYCQEVIVSDLNAFGRIEQVVRMWASMCLIEHVDKENHTGFETGEAYIYIGPPDGDPLRGCGQVALRNILLEQIGSKDKAGVKVHRCNSLSIDHYHCELTESMYHLELTQVKEARIRDVASVATNPRRIRIADNSVAVFEEFFGSIAADTWRDIFDVDNTSSMQISRLGVVQPTGTFPLNDRVTVAELVDISALSTGSVWRQPVTKIECIGPHGNIFANASFEIGAHGWKVVAQIPPHSMDNPASDLTMGRALRFVWARDAKQAIYIMQSLNVPEALVGRAMSLTIHGKIIGGDDKTYIAPLLNGPLWGSGPVGGHIKAGGGWTASPITVIPQAAGVHFFGCFIINPVATAEYWLDEFSLSFGNMSATQSAISGGRRYMVSRGGALVAGPIDEAGYGSPEGVIAAPVGSTWRRLDGGSSSSFYVKEHSDGVTGWVAK